ncbi:dihydrofolate reductase family protein [Aeromicrobium sp. Sec7.5]|uniref:dihydrofolate reductase family protein n=1 Tax=Aeromicrobium sp. Sec7.5 TaxID=3121276 RepID=UPI002FE44235
MTEHRAWKGAVFIAASVDGFIALPDGDLTWLTDPPSEPRHVPSHAGEDAPPGYEDFIAGVSHLVMGRGTYEKVLTFGFWPYENLHVVVLSTVLPADADTRITVVRSLTEARHRLDLDAATGVYIDGGQVLTEFLRHDLVDELTVTRAPVLLGHGLPLFHSLPHEIRLVHLGTSISDAGMTSTRYAVARAAID